MFPLSTRSQARMATVAMLLSISPLACRPLSAADRVPYSEFSSMLTSDLDSLQVKLTWMGAQISRVPTLAITADGHAPALAGFRPYYRPEFRLRYSSDYSPPVAAALSTTALASMIDSIDTLPDVTDGAIDTAAVWSFGLHNTVDGIVKVFESVISYPNAQSLLRKIRPITMNDADASPTIDQYSCEVGLLTGTPISDVTNSVSLEFGGFRRNRHHEGRFVQNVKLTNLSAVSIAAPIRLVLVPVGNVRLSGAAGRTCLAHPRRAQYVMALASGSLAPSQSIEVAVNVTNPDSETITYRLRKVFAGAGEP